MYTVLPINHLKGLFLSSSKVECCPEVLGGQLPGGGGEVPGPLAPAVGPPPAVQDVLQPAPLGDHEEARLAIAPAQNNQPQFLAIGIDF